MIVDRFCVTCGMALTDDACRTCTASFASVTQVIGPQTFTSASAYAKAYGAPISCTTSKAEAASGVCPECGVPRERGSCTVCRQALFQSAGAPPIAAPQVRPPVSKRRGMDLHRAVYLAAWGGAGGLVGGLLGELAKPERTAVSMVESCLDVGIWFAMIGCLIAFAIAAGQSRYLGRKAIRMSSLKTAGFGFGAAFVAGAIAQAAYTNIGPTEVLRDFCWGLAGMLVGGALSVRIPNLGLVRGLAGGLIGGLLGGGLFILLAGTIGALVGRSIGCGAIGFMIGLMIVFSETLFREAWLEVTYGPKECRTISLGKDPIRIGSDSNACAVYVSGVPAVARIYTLENRRIACEDAVSGGITYPSSGTSQTIGNISIIVRTG